LSKRIGEEILEALTKTFKVKLGEFVALIAKESNNPFELLVAVILSQNTNDKNSIRAFEQLRKRFILDPHYLMNVPEKEIEEAIKIAGLYRTKARAIKELSKILVEKYGGDLWKILKKPLEEARSELLSLPKIGPKTADVLLLFIANKPTFPIDTHIKRIATRMGLVRPNSGYETIRRTLMELFPENKYLEAHLLLILLGRNFCKAKNPQCSSCPVKELCNFVK